MRTLFVDTPSGRLGFFYPGWSGKPIAVLIHGFARSAEQHFDWRGRLPDHDVIFACLPGHGNAPQIDGGLTNYIRAFRSALSAFPSQPDLVLGESLGALIAMTIKARLTVAIDPFLRTGHLWPLQTIFSEATPKNLEWVPLYEELLADKDYSPLVDMIVSPTRIIAGDRPLLPKRPMGRTPSLLGEDDERLFRRSRHVSVQRIPGGHQLLDEQADLCRQLILEMLA